MAAEIISRESIKPSSPTPSHLNKFDHSALDQLIEAPYAPIILYYPNNNGDNQALERSQVLKKSLSETLTQFYPLAGTIKNNLSIDCNDVGANYIVALVHRRLEDFLQHPDLGLINSFLPTQPFFRESSDKVTNVKVNIFECGGIAIGLCISHKIVDAAAMYTFLKGWSNMARGAEEVVYPNFTASSLFPVKGSGIIDAMKVLGHSRIREGKFCIKRFVFGSDAIARLRARAARNGGQQPTSVEVVSALIWKCAMVANKEACSFEKPSSLTHTVNLRRKLKAPLSSHLMGNIIWFSNAVLLDTDDNQLQTLVNRVCESISIMDVDFVDKAQGDAGYVALVKSLKEMGETESIGTTVNYTFSSWCKMGFYEIDFGWGKPSWVTPATGHGIPLIVNFVFLLDTKSGEGIEAWVSLDEPEMEILQNNQELLSYASLDPSPLINDEAKKLTNKFMAN